MKSSTKGFLIIAAPIVVFLVVIGAWAPLLTVAASNVQMVRTLNVVLGIASVLSLIGFPVCIIIGALVLTKKTSL